MSAGAPLRKPRRSRASKNVEWALLDDVTINKSFDVPYLAGYSKDGNTVYIDRHLARAAPIIDGWPFAEWSEALVIHEVVEKREIDKGLSYEDAHLNYATPAEHQFLKSCHLDPAEYERELRPYIKAAEHERVKSPPQDLDCTPYRGVDKESQSILAHLRKRGVRDADDAKRSHTSVQYGQGTKDEHCGNCVHYQIRGHCDLVVDPIHVKGWCKLWAAKVKVS